MFYWLVWLLVYLPLRIFYATKIIGKKNITKLKGKAILSCNHTSNWDAVLIDSRMCVAKNPYILAKHTLFKNKFFGAILKSWKIIPVNRTKVEISTIKKVLTVLKDDKKLLIFPQGTRREEDEFSEVKNGLAMFALKTKSPIVPMWFVKKPKFLRRNILLIGEPFCLTEFENQPPTKEVLDKASEVVVNKMFELRDNYIKQQESKQQAKLLKKQERL